MNLPDAAARHRRSVRVVGMVDRSHGIARPLRNHCGHFARQHRHPHLRIRELMEGPTQRCRYCQGRYPSAEDTYVDRTCYRRVCRKRYYRYRTALNKAEEAVLELWKAIAPETDGVLSNENLKRRDAELTEAHKEVERWHGGESSVARRTSSLTAPQTHAGRRGK
jgi:hypothetical protein